MSVLHKGAWRPFVLLAAVCAAAVTLWMVVAAMVPATAGASAAHGVHHKAKKHHARRHHKAKKHPAKKSHPTKPGQPTSHGPVTSGQPTSQGPVTSGQATSHGPVMSGHLIATSLPGQLTSGSYTNGAGSLDYEFYVPSTYRAGSPMPVVVALHGCTESADSYRQLSGWDALGESKGFIVLFPQQLSSRNNLTCWNWFVQPDMQRGSGEPAIISGMVNTLEQLYSVDTNRVYVAGFSAGGAMANVMGATYPDMFAAVGSGSGCEYNGLPCLGNGGPSPSQTGQEAFQAMGRYARVMPAIVFQGDADNIVAPANGPQIAQEWQVTDNYVASGSPNSPISTYPMNESFGFTPGGTMYTTSYYGDGQSKDLIEYWSIHGMSHAWSGGNSSQQYADPSGPSETDAMWAFFTSHPL
jgi:poly(hydroxyalkanoate) depolymerase family esterase